MLNLKECAELPEKSSRIADVEEKSPSKIDRDKLKCPFANYNRNLVKHEPLQDEKKKLISPSKRLIECKESEKINRALGDYFKDLRKRSNCCETLENRPFESSELKKLMYVLK